MGWPLACVIYLVYDASNQGREIMAMLNETREERQAFEQETMRMGNTLWQALQSHFVGCNHYIGQDTMIYDMDQASCWLTARRAMRGSK